MPFLPPNQQRQSTEALYEKRMLLIPKCSLLEQAEWRVYWFTHIHLDILVSY